METTITIIEAAAFLFGCFMAGLILQAAAINTLSAALGYFFPDDDD